jgi:molybdopterin molybdotransferase
VISVAEASETILRKIEALTGESVATEGAVGRVLSQAVSASIDSPPWDNSSMDGYAARAADIDHVPATLSVIEEIAAGAFPSRSIAAGEAMRVMTGAPVPRGCDTVVRREDTDDGRDVVTISSRRDAGKNIRRKGEDFHAGDKLFEAGEEMRVPHAGALASAGIKTVSVHRRPTVALVSSGDELVELRDFSLDLAEKKIVSSNSVTLGALLKEAGAIPLDLGIARDDRASLIEKLERTEGCDLILTTAGISVGDHDHVRDAVQELGGKIDFWKVRMRPGAPLAFGTINGIPWIGMSGNPVSAMVSFEVFVRPVIRRMLGHSALFGATVPVRIRKSITLAAPLMHFLRVDVSENNDGGYGAELAGSQSSSVITAMARANALLILPGDRLEIDEGEIHRALPLGNSLTTSHHLELT